jgi:hypothetical protein
LLLSWILSASSFIHSQNYHAIQGSPFAGSTGVMNNPASISSTPYPWDITLMGVQMKTSTNAVELHNFSYLHSNDTIGIKILEGNFSRFANISYNLNILNVRITLNRNSSIAFGANLRSYLNLSTSPFQFVDTLHGSGTFFSQNQGNSNISMDDYHSGWLELFGTYSRTLIDNPIGRLNAGATLKLSRGASGGFVSMRNLNFTQSIQNNQPLYTLTSGSLQYGYSANYDQINKANSTSRNLHDFLAYSEGGLSFDLGAEYLLKNQEVRTAFDDDDFYDYDWKFGAALLDIGANQFKYGKESRSANGFKTIVTNEVLDAKFDSSITSLPTFNDSLATIMNTGTPPGKFTILNPMRLVLNADHALSGGFYINAEMSLNFPTGIFQKYYRVNEMNFLTLTPRWETSNLGVYLPIQFNSNSQFWIGGAFKAGPLLIGVHNWSNIFSKNKSANGGGYLALVIRSPRKNESKRDKKLDCPPGLR